MAKLIRVGEVARTIGVAPATIRRWSDAGDLPVAFRSGGGKSQRYFALDTIRSIATRDAVEAKEPKP